MTGKNACTRAAVPCDEVVTAAPASPAGDLSYYVYVLARNEEPDVPGTLAGLQCGIDYETAGPGTGVVVSSWKLCATMEFPANEWPEAGSGNLMTWDTNNHCQSGQLGVAGYFYVTPYSPGTLRLTPRPVDSRAAVANCAASENDVYPGRLGWVSFGGAALNGDTDGFNPCREPSVLTAPIIRLRGPWQGNVVDEDDLSVSWHATDDATPFLSLEFSWRLDGSSWSDDERPEHPFDIGLRLDDLPTGPHLFEVRCRDEDGETSEASVAFTSLAEPNRPPDTFIVSGPLEGDTVTVPVTFQVSATDDRTPVEEIRYRFWIDEGGIEARNDAGSAGMVTYDALSAGTHVFHARAQDTEGEADRTPATRTFFVREPGEDLLENQLPLRFVLRSIEPNPTRGQALVLFDLDRAGSVRLTVFDVHGRSVRTLDAGSLDPGRKTLIWDGTANGGSAVASGLYFIRVEASGRFVTGRVSVAR